MTGEREDVDFRHRRPSRSDLSTAVPVTNALTLVFTYLCDVLSRPSLLNSSKWSTLFFPRRRKSSAFRISFRNALRDERRGSLRFLQTSLKLRFSLSDVHQPNFGGSPSSSANVEFPSGAKRFVKFDTSKRKNSTYFFFRGEVQLRRRVRSRISAHRWRTNGSRSVSKLLSRQIDETSDRSKSKRK